MPIILIAAGLAALYFHSKQTQTLAASTGNAVPPPSGRENYEQTSQIQLPPNWGQGQTQGMRVTTLPDPVFTAPPVVPQGPQTYAPEISSFFGIAQSKGGMDVPARGTVETEEQKLARIRDGVFRK